MEQIRGINLSGKQLTSLVKLVGPEGKRSSELIHLYLTIWNYGDLNGKKLTVDVVAEDMKWSYRHTLQTVAKLSDLGLIEKELKVLSGIRYTIITNIKTIN